MLIDIYVHIVLFNFSPLHRVSEQQYALLHVCFIFQNLSWWSYDSGSPSLVFVRSPWYKVDLCWIFLSNL